MSNKPILTFPYHDPNGMNNNMLRETLPLLQELFSHICIGATPASARENNDFLLFLESQGCRVYRNEEGTGVGDHYRSALRLAVACEGTHVFFAMIDRLLFGLNTHHRQECLQHMQECLKHEIMLLERTPAAWETHPVNYREIEQAVNQMAKYMIGKEVELGSCGMSMSMKVAERVLEHSISATFSAGAEWILFFYAWGYDPHIQKADWLSWEDPFIDGVDAQTLKTERENNPQEVRKRIVMNAEFVELLKEQRFVEGLLK